MGKVWTLLKKVLSMVKEDLATLFLGRIPEEYNLFKQKDKRKSQNNKDTKKVSSESSGIPHRLRALISESAHRIPTQPQ
jgi:hypothetical protein